MLGLLLIAALIAATLVVAQRLGLLSELLSLVGAAFVGGLAFLALHPQLDWIAPLPDGADASCGAGELPEPQPPTITRISVAEARGMLGSGQVTFIDARPIHAYAQAHVPGALSLPAYEAEGLLEMQSLPIPPDGRVITYCEGGRCEQSEYLSSVLSERGVCREILVLDGGWQAWLAADAPRVSGASRFGAAPATPQLDTPQLQPDPSRAAAAPQATPQATKVEQAG